MRYKINLLTHKKTNTVDRCFYFVSHYLRYILVITLLLTIGVFFYKIIIDQAIIDVFEAVSQKQEILLVSKPLIEQSQNINLKINEVQNVIAKQDKLSKLLEYLLSTFPEGFNLSKFNTDGEVIDFTGKTSRPELLQVFYYRLQKEGRFKQVRLSNIEKKQGEVHFNFSLKDFLIK